MRLSSKWIIFFLAALLAFVDIGFCADVAKIGVVELQRVVENSDAGKEIKTRITTQYEKMMEELKGKESEIKELKKRMDRESLVMSKEMREEKEREFRIKVNDIKMLQKKYEGELQQLQKRMIGGLRKETLKIVEEIGKSEGYLMIMDKLGVLYSPSTIDITDEVIKRYNATYAKTNNKKKD